VRHSCWCPKVIAAIGRLPDTLADRCIVITMQRKTANEHCERMRDVNGAELRAQCAQWAREHRDEIAKAQPALPPNLNDRAADIWEPLLIIADIVGGQWPELARQAAVKLSSGDEEPTLLGYFLQDLRAVFKFAKTDRMFSRDIVELMNPIHDRPWEDLRRGREINEWWLGQHLRELGIKSRTVWIGDVSAKGYLLEDFEEAFRRYLPQAGMTNHQAPITREAPITNIQSESGQKLQEQFERLMERLEQAAKGAEGGEAANDANSREKERKVNADA
jgi:putative DNA primase/helicase